MDPVTGMMIAQGAGQLGGMLMGGYNESKQLRQQQKLQDMQVKGNKEMLDQLAEKERMMLRESAIDQVYGLEKAGLSKSMMMGKGGAGGVTGGAAGAPSGASADGGAARMMAQTQLASTMADIALKKAQAKNIDADTKNKSFDNEVRATIGTTEYSEQIKAELNKERVENVTEYRKAVAIMDALGGTDPEKMFALDKFGNYDNTEFSKLGKEQTKFMMDQFKKLEADINKVNQDIESSKQGMEESKANEALLKVEAEIRDFKADLSGLGLNETTAKILELLLKGMLGIRGQNIMKNR